MAASTHKTIGDAVVAQIVALELRDYPNNNLIGSSRVVFHWGIEIATIQLPGIFVSPVGTKSVSGGTNERDDWVYPISIYICDRQSLTDPLVMDAALNWRERIERRFIGQRLPGAAQVNLPTAYNASPVIDDKIVSAFQVLVEPIFLSFFCRQTRGLY